MRRVATGLLLVALAGPAGAAAAEGKSVPPQAIEGFALARSYAPGQVARIALLGRTSEARVAVFHAGLERSNRVPSKELLGAPVHAQVALTPHEARIDVGSWPSGLYFARID